ncbi:MAG: EAL domain-containing response regulator [Kofleriaceae bacterium]
MTTRCSSLAERWLRAEGFDVMTARGADEAMRYAMAEPPDAILSDVMMDQGDGFELARRIRHDPATAAIPVVLLSAHVEGAEDSAVATALGASALVARTPNFDVALGALKRCLATGTQPMAATPPPEPRPEPDNARARYRALVERGHAAVSASRETRLAAHRRQASAQLDAALAAIEMAYQPITVARTGEVFAYEALVRSTVPAMARPDQLFAAAVDTNRLPELGRAIRAAVATTLTTRPSLRVFVNLHPSDLLDEDLLDPAAPLSAFAERVVLEITERAPLDEIADLPSRLAALRAMGYQLALDDLGAGYAGLTSFVQLTPEVVKLDMFLVRDCDTNPTKRKIIQSVQTLCGELGIRVVAEGIETQAERATLLALGCDLMQGYLMARPGPLPDSAR